LLQSSRERNFVIKVAVVDDQALVRGGFTVLVDAAEDMEVVGEAANGAEAVEVVTRQHPDVVLMDIRMPVIDGIEATRQITANPETAATKILILTTFDLDEYVYGALRAGASGFLLKDTRPEELLAGIRTLAEGEALLAPSVTRRLIAEFVQRPDGAPSPVPVELKDLTRREMEVLIQSRALQRRHRCAAQHQRRDRQNPCQPTPDETSRPRPSPARRRRLRVTPHYSDVAEVRGD
jgi:DNA-binding NarL/FixJ family response regulator